MKTQISSIAIIAMIGLSIFTFSACSKETCKNGDEEINSNLPKKVVGTTSGIVIKFTNNTASSTYELFTKIIYI